MSCLLRDAARVETKCTAECASISDRERGCHVVGPQPTGRPGPDQMAVRLLTYGTYKTYALAMTELTVSDARTNFAEVVDRARTRHEPVSLTKNGRRIAVVIDAEDFDRMVELAEDALDNAAADEAEPAGEFLPWDEVKAELGWA